MNQSRRKIDAIYELRRAAEEKVLAEKALEDEPGAKRRDELLEAQMTLEEKTLDAIDVCHECGHAHDSGGAHGAREPR